MKVLAIVAVVLVGMYFVDQNLYYGRYSNGVSEMLRQVAGSFGLRR